MVARVLVLEVTNKATKNKEMTFTINNIYVVNYILLFIIYYQT